MRRAAAGCRCSNGSSGRKRNLFILPDGRRVWPALEISTDEARDRLPPISNTSSCSTHARRWSCWRWPPRPFTPDEQRTLCEWIDRAVGHPMEARITYVDTIPRGTTGKYEDVRSEVNADDAG